MEWYYAKHGKQEGPVDLATLQGKLQSGELAATDLVWREGMPEWKAAGDVVELNVGPSPGAPRQAAPAPGPAGTQAPGQPGTQAPGQPATQAAGQMPGAAPARTAGPVTVSPPGGTVAGSHQQIPNYLVPAILVTILCCPPFGIPAIVFAAKVDSLVAQGDVVGAQEASDKAKMWTWIAAGLGVASNVIVFVLFFLASFQA